MELLLDSLAQRRLAMPAVVRAGGALAERWRARPEVVALRVRGAWDLWAALRLSRLARERGARLLAAHDGTAHTLALWAARFHPALRLVVHRRVLSSPRWRRKYRHGCIAGFVAVSGAVARVLQTCGVPEARIRVVYDAADPRRFAALDPARCRRTLRERHRLPPGAFLVGAAAQLEPAKGIRDLLEACAHSAGALEREGAWALLIAGEGPERGSLGRRARETGLGERVRFEGYVRELPEWLAGLDLFVVPSRREGLGSVALEAALAGVPRIVTDAGGLPEIVEHERTGLVVPAGDPRALSCALLEIRSCPARARALAQRAAARVREAHAPERMAAETLAAYAAFAAQSK